ncbi:MAG TPA: RNA polymerase factor sigma-54 [Leucothrix mucor]|uniref:RNA polymerase sigma-54 factor n=1 Tax=Leucothrix mucor TaxID=45248 RepID=A0A7V2SZ21_LEUMU|nr:RNA polymerase factor sigma-54 [Leucothrix mucor]
MLKQGLSVKLGQRLSMTPQLQQAIRLLQLSSIELQQEIQENLDMNPLLERVEDSINEVSQDENKQDNKTVSDEENTAIPEELNIDTSWDEIYDTDWRTGNNNAETSASDLIDVIHSPVKTLRDHLQELIDLSQLSAIDKEIAATIISYINPQGFLTESTQQIFTSLQHTLLIEEDEVDVILQYIQNMGPIGVGARNLSEALLLQLKYFYNEHLLYKKTQELLQKHLDLIEKRDYISIKKTLKLTTGQFDELMELIQSLNPYPGNMFDISTTNYITPDVYVQKIKGLWVVSLNQETLPKLQINDYYSNMLTHLSNKKDRDYLKNNAQQARWLIKSIENRNSTVLNVANAIVERQVAFFQYGEEAMKPMVLKDLAEQLELHESTISRVTTQKYMHTPRGVYEFKYFFSSHIRTTAGGVCSATAIQAMIKKLITSESNSKPLSDSKLTNLLKEQGINVARRTVAKYREAMNIPSSHERKTFA